MPRSALLLPIGLLLVAMTSIQSGASLAKSLFPLIGAEGTTALRLGLGALILAVTMRPWRTPITRQSWRPLVAYGVALGCMNLMFYMSLQRIPLGIAVALEFTGPLVLALLGSRRLIDFAWILLAAFGLWLLLPVGQNDAHLDPIGIALALGAGVSWAFYIIFGQQAGASHGPQAVALGTAIAALLVFPVGLWQNGAGLFSLDILPIALIVAIMSSALPYSLEMVALTRLPARVFSVLMSIEPAIAALSGLLFLGERLSAIQWLAVAAIITASTGTALTIKPKG
ncbi:threonine/homoserine exporter RhtA [Pseudomonas sp. LRF_L74]|uniref:threonine/homoserine exporter RhtA n=1 Tax=Pseudomonas sp. LRF_L74 TaxID=3369422 RepID=UPI003F6137E5